jgi:hypothetical protein
VKTDTQEQPGHLPKDKNFSREIKKIKPVEPKQIAFTQVILQQKLTESNNSHQPLLFSC